MKKTLILLCAVSAIAFTACDKNEMVSRSNDGAISFRTLIQGSLKAGNDHENTSKNLEQFVVLGYGSADAQYNFANEVYTKQADRTFTSEAPHYWPKDGSTLNFFAYAPKASEANKIEYNVADTNKWTVSQVTEAAKQPDLIVAKNCGNRSFVTGLSLNFRHTMSKVSLKVMNSMYPDSLEVSISNWKIGYLTPKETFTFPASEINTVESGLLQRDTWTANGTKSVENYVEAEALAEPFAVTNTDDYAIVDGFNHFIIIPQILKDSKNEYVNAENGSAWNGSYVAVKASITGKSGIKYADNIYCCWPLNLTFEPGKHYYLCIDLGEGGFYETNTPYEINPSNPSSLDPIIPIGEDADVLIKFVNVTVDEWVDEW